MGAQITIEPAAHIFPSDLRRFQEQETFAFAYSVDVGNPVEKSVPVYTLTQFGNVSPERIVSCVKALDGITNPELKIPRLKDEIIEAAEQIVKLEQRHERMLSALRMADNALQQKRVYIGAVKKAIADAGGA